MLFLQRKPQYTHLYGFAYNAFEGAFPEGIQADVAFEGNNFEYFPFSYLEQDNRINVGLGKITGEIPPEILDDPVKLHKLYSMVYPTQDGYGYSNMPPEEEVKRRYEEYLKDHSDENK